jgi:hypothetical protein
MIQAAAATDTAPAKLASTVRARVGNSAVTTLPMNGNSRSMNSDMT